MRRGLVVGKFMPLHRGHQLLIDMAMAECDDVTIVVYDSRPAGDPAPIPLELRLGWLRDLYPRADSILGVPDPWADDEGTDGPEYAARYAEDLAFLGPFDRFYSSEPAYEAFAAHLGAEHRVVDDARTLVPISGTEIRSDPFRYRGWMSPTVYASLIQKVVFVGTESTGKSTLARALADRHRTLWTHEYGRELWVQNDGGTYHDHWRMGERQWLREEAALRHSRRFLFCDTNAWTTLMWSRWAYDGRADARLEELVRRTTEDYVWVLCDNDFGWIQDGTREMRDGAAQRFQAMLVADLTERGIAFHRVSGPLEERIAQVDDLLGVGRLHAAVPD